MRKLLFLLLVIVTLLLEGEDNLTQESNLSAMMNQLSTVSEEERFVLMNAIKRELVKLKTQQRKEAIQALRTSMEHNATDSNTTTEERMMKTIKVIPQHLENRPEPPHRDFQEHQHPPHPRD